MFNFYIEGLSWVYILPRNPDLSPLVVSILQKYQSYLNSGFWFPKIQNRSPEICRIYRHPLWLCILYLFHDIKMISKDILETILARTVMDAGIKWSINWDQPCLLTSLQFYIWSLELVGWEKHILSDVYPPPSLPTFASLNIFVYIFSKNCS